MKENKILDWCPRCKNFSKPDFVLGEQLVLLEKFPEVAVVVNQKICVPCLERGG